LIVLLAKSPPRGLRAAWGDEVKDKRPNGIIDARDPRVSTAIVDVMTWPSAGATRGSRKAAESSNVFGGQASKGIRWMPWLQEAMKDVVKLRKATVSR
jgi:hypothetical protein